MAKKYRALYDPKGAETKAGTGYVSSLAEIPGGTPYTWVEEGTKFDTGWGDVIWKGADVPTQGNVYYWGSGWAPVGSRTGDFAWRGTHGVWGSSGRTGEPSRRVLGSEEETFASAETQSAKNKAAQDVLMWRQRQAGAGTVGYQTMGRTGGT